MSELRRAVLSVDVIGSALRDIKDIRKEWEELKSRGAIPIDLKVNVSQTGQTLDVLARQVRDATAAYETLANTASSFHARSLQAIRPNVSPVIDISAYKKVLSGAESLIGSTKLAIPGIISPPNVPKMGTSSPIESIKPALSGVLDSIEKEISTLSTGDVPKKIELPTPEIPEIKVPSLAPALSGALDSIKKEISSAKTSEEAIRRPINIPELSISGMGSTLNNTLDSIRKEISGFETTVPSKIFNEAEFARSLSRVIRSEQVSRQEYSRIQSDYERLSQATRVGSMRVPTTSKIEAPTGEDFGPAIDGFQSLTKEMDNYERKAQATSDRNKTLSSSIDFLTDSLAKYRNRLILATGALAGFTAVTGTMALGINESISELERFAEAKGLNADATLEWIRQEEKIPGLSTQLKAALSNSYLRDYASSIGLLDEQIETMVSYWEINQSRIGKSKEAFITDIVSGNVEQYKSLLKMPPWAVTRQWHQASIDVRKQLGYYDEAEINKRARTLAALQLMGLSTEQAASKKH